MGHEQSRRLAAWLGDCPPVNSTSSIDIACLCASPQLRAQQTADHVAAALALRVQTVEDLREAPFHVQEHLPRAATPLADAKSAPSSDTYTVFKAQAQQAFEQLVAMAAGGPVLTVAHGGLIKTLLRIAVHSDVVDFRTYNTGMTLIEWRSGRWYLEFLNLQDHLTPPMRTF